MDEDPAFAQYYSNMQNDPDNFVIPTIADAVKSLTEAGNFILAEEEALTYSVCFVFIIYIFSPLISLRYL